MIELLASNPEPGEINRDTPISFEIRTEDSNTFLRVIVAILYPTSQVVEMAYAQNPESGTSSFEPFYSSVSTVEEVSDPGWKRFRFTVRRKATNAIVWPDSPAVQIYAFNDAGEEL